MCTVSAETLFIAKIVSRYMTLVGEELWLNFIGIICLHTKYLPYLHKGEVRCKFTKTLPAGNYRSKCLD